jgi:signal transduction histidine kinase
MLDRLGQLPDSSIVLYAGILQDVTGQAYVPSRVCPLVTSASSAPVFGVFSTWIGCGVVGGVITDFEDLARQTARLAIGVIERGSTAGIPVEAAPNKTVIDWRQLQRWRISDERLPPNAVVRFRTASVWERYRWYVVGAGAAFLIQLVVIVVLMLEMRKRKKSEKAVIDLSGRLISAGEEERKRIARELHDDISQRLAVVSLELAALELESVVNESRSTRSAQPLQHLNEIITDVHNLSRQLHSNRLQFLGLGAALNELCQHITAHHDIAVQLVTNDVDLTLRQDIALCFYRVAQEALNNSVKHSGSPRIELRVTTTDGVLRMSIRDFGSGFVPGSRTSGVGLATMRERLRLVHGKLAVNSRPGGGTEVIAEARIDATVPEPVNA